LWLDSVSRTHPQSEGQKKFIPSRSCSTLFASFGRGFARWHVKADGGAVEPGVCFRGPPSLLDRPAHSNTVPSQARFNCWRAGPYFCVRWFWQAIGICVRLRGLDDTIEVGNNRTVFPFRDTQLLAHSLLHFTVLRTWRGH